MVFQKDVIVDFIFNVSAKNSDFVYNFKSYKQDNLAMEIVNKFDFVNYQK